MSKPESGTEYAFRLESYTFVGDKKFNKKYKIVKMENGLRAPNFGEPMEGEFTEQEKDKLEGC